MSNARVARFRRPCETAVDHNHKYSGTTVPRPQVTTYRTKLYRILEFTLWLYWLLESVLVPMQINLNASTVKGQSMVIT